MNIPGLRRIFVYFQGIKRGPHSKSYETLLTTRKVDKKTSSLGSALCFSQKVGLNETKPNNSPLATVNIFKSKLACPMLRQDASLHIPV
jgi:hypothetical protein